MLKVLHVSPYFFLQFFMHIFVFFLSSHSWFSFLAYKFNGETANTVNKKVEV